MSETNQLNENISQTIANIAQLQKAEKELYSELNNTNVNSIKKQIIDKISNIYQIRTDLFKTIENTQSFVQSEVNQSMTTLKDQLKAIKIMENSLKDMKIYRDKIETKNTDLHRGLEITQYYGKKYSAQIAILKSIIIFCIPIIILNILITNKIIPSLTYVFTITIIFFIGVYIIMNQVMDISSRSKTNFDKYDWA